jgi:DNA topoisomerase-3
LSLKFDLQKETSTISCPKCGKGHIVFYPKTAKCTEKDCNLVVFRKILNKILTDQQLKQLFSCGKTKPIKDFKNRLEKLFEASVAFGKDYKTKLVFDKPTSIPKNRDGDGKKK